MNCFCGAIVRRLLTVLVLVCCGVAHADVPRKIGYQGVLTGAGGVPVNGTVALAFRLYGDLAGGAPLYAESLNVTVFNGVFNVLIGTVIPLTLPFDQPYYLGVAVGADPEMTPRQPLASAPFAIHSATAGALSASATVAGSQITGSIASGTLPTSNLVGAISPAMLSTTGCAPGQILKYVGATWTCASESASGGTVTSVGAGSGLTGGPITTSGTLALAATVPNWTGGTPSCANGDAMTSIAANGVATCESVVRAPKSGLAYAFVYSCQLSACSISSQYAFNSTGQSISGARSGVGAYSVTFTGLTSANGGHVQVTAYGGSSTMCKVTGWSFPTVLIACFAAGGAAADSDFTVLAIP